MSTVAITAIIHICFRHVPYFSQATLLHPTWWSSEGVGMFIQLHLTLDHWLIPPRATLSAFAQRPWRYALDREQWRWSDTRTVARKHPLPIRWCPAAPHTRKSSTVSTMKTSSPFIKCIFIWGRFSSSVENSTEMPVEFSLMFSKLPATFS